MSTQSNVTECVTEMRDSVKDLSAAETQEITNEMAKVGAVVRQGDIYLTRIDKLPEGKPSKERQLAEGETQGSRHVITGDVELVTGVSFGRVNQVLVGPAFKCNGKAELTHPEHGNKILPEGSIWQVTYQQAYADEVRRVQD